ncbi:MAG: hypothetical protein U0946_02135, partial [Patescibacteria group bacterium]|nr:hypothetical protein [Patescibacteria group bacterium]
MSKVFDKVKTSQVNGDHSKLFVDEGLIHEGAPGPYVYLTDFGHELTGLQQSTLADEVVSNLKVHSQDETVKEAFRQVTFLANLGVELADPYFGILYSAAFTLGYVPVFKAAVADLKHDITLIAPLRGGKIVQVIARALGLSGDNKPINQVVEVRASRVVLKNGNYLIGVFEPRPEADQPLAEESPIIANNNVLFGDDCRAAGGSEHTLILWCQHQNPKIKRVVSAVGMGVKRTSRELLDHWQNSQVSYLSHVGEVTNSMNKDYYLNTTADERKQKNLPESCVYTVNDMGSAMSLSGERG